jgi:hypothetical protein
MVMNSEMELCLRALQFDAASPPTLAGKRERRPGNQRVTGHAEPSN